MISHKLRWLLLVVVLVALVILSYTINSPETVHAQQPTGSIPTVTGTPTGPVAVSKVGWTDNINVRSAPSTNADQIGILLPGQKVYVKGKTVAGDWLLIDYPGVADGEGWIWALYMDIGPGEVPIVELPPTPAPKVTATIDPTLAAQFVITPNATRMPTFTQPAPLTLPTYVASTSSTGSIPVGLVIIIIAGFGIVIGLFSIFQSR
jgi:hypothetical protein